jgi:RND superfamily putative drug exporter
MTTTRPTPTATTPEVLDVVPEPRAPKPSEQARGIAAWCAQHRWRTLAAALLVLVGAAVLLSGGLKTSSNTDQLVGDSAEAVRVAAAADFGDRPVETVVVTSTEKLTSADVSRLAGQISAAYSPLTGIAGVAEAVTSPDGRTLVVPVALDAARAADGTVPDRTVADESSVDAMLAETKKLQDANPELKVGQVGGGSIDAEVGEALSSDFQRAELISLPVTLGVLLIAFGAVVTAGVPVLLGIGAVVAALGLTAWTSRTITPVDQNTQSLVLLIGLAVGVDYSMFVLRRVQEERRAGASVREAIVTAGRTAGRAVVISGVTVVVAMSGMLVAGGLFTSLAIGAMLVVAVAVLASATVLPALLSVLGDRVNAIRLPFSRRRAERQGERGFWGRLAGTVARRPLLWTVAAATALLALAAPALGMRTALPGAESLPRSFETVDAYERLTAAFPQDGTTVDVVVTAPASASAQVESALTGAFTGARGTGEVVGDSPAVKTSKDQTVHVLELAVPYHESAPELAHAVDTIRDDVLPGIRSSLAGIDDVKIHIGGAAAVTDLTSWLNERLPWVMGFVLVLTLVVMALSFGSLWLSFATVGLNLLSVGAAYGVLTLVFQNHWAEGLLDFTSIGSIAAWLPLLMFVVLFGLSMDYHVFVVSRVREAWSSGSSPREAVRLGVGRSAGVVTSAAAVMVSVFAVFATLSSLEMKQLGVGLATAVLVDATLVRGVLLPGVLALLGDRAHTGPRWLPALHH